MLYDHVAVDGEPAPGLIAVVVLWVFNNYDALKRAGTGVYFYIPKMQTPREALIVEKLLARVEGIIGLPAGTLKIKILYEEGNGGRYLPAIAWVLRRRLLGTNVGRWDYLGSLMEMWKDDPDGVFPDPQTVGMAAPNMIAYQRYNALTMLMAGMKHGELTQGCADRRDGSRDDLSVERRLWPLALQSGGHARDRRGQAPRAAAGADVRARRGYPGRSSSYARRCPRRSRQGKAVRHVSAELGCQPGVRVCGCGKRPSARAFSGLAGGTGCAARDGGR